MVYAPCTKPASYNMEYKPNVVGGKLYYRPLAQILI